MSTGHRWDSDVAFAAAADVTRLGWITPEEHGALGNGVTDDTTALNAASAAAKAAGATLFLPSLTYLISDTVSVETNLQASGATLLWAGGDKGVALSLGSGTNSRTDHKEMHLPKVQQQTSNFTDEDVGVRIWSLSASKVFFGFVTGFSVAALFTSGAGVPGNYGPTQYNTYFIGQLGGKVPIRVEGGPSWNNECTYIGGSCSVLPGSMPTPWTGARNIQVRLPRTPMPSVALRVDSTAGQVNAGAHTYVFTFVDSRGYEGPFSWPRFLPSSSIVTNDSTHTSNDVTVPALSAFNLPGYPDAVSIRLYRTKVGGVQTRTGLYLVASGLTPSSTYVDTTPDASLGANPDARGGLPNHHRFRDINVESAGQSEYAVECEGGNNLFSWLRYEHVSLAPPVLFNGGYATQNVIEKGLYSELIVLSQTNGANNNTYDPISLTRFAHPDADITPNPTYRFHAWSPSANRAVAAPNPSGFYVGQEITFDITNTSVGLVTPTWDPAFVLGAPFRLKGV